MSSYNNDHFLGKLAVGAGVFLLIGMIHSFPTEEKRELSTNIGDNSNNYYFDEESDKVFSKDPLYTNESTIDYSRYKEAEYEPFTHTLYLKIEGTLPFYQVSSISAPEGYQVDYFVSSEILNEAMGNNYVYGHCYLEFTNTEKVVVREYYDTATGKYINTNFGTVVEKEKQKTIEQ